MRQRAELVEEGLRYPFVVDEGGRARVGRLVSFSFAIGGDGRADLGEGGREVARGVDEGSAGVANGDTYKFDTSPVSSKGVE